MIGIFIITVTAFLLAIFIMFISEKFKDDSKDKEFLRLLPGYNCGVCGYGTCQGLAQAMNENPQFYQKCKPLRGEALSEMENYLKGNNLI